MGGNPRFKFLIVFCILSGLVSAQASGLKFSITGKIIDNATGKPVEYTNIVVYSAADSNMVTGCTSDPQGFFMLTDLKPGRYFMTAKFIGYHIYHSGEFEISMDKPRYEFGNIILLRAPVEGETVEVYADLPPIEYQIEKNVVHVPRNFNNGKGSAIEVLETVPEAEVDIMGKVKLRGSSSYKVLIDDRPTLGRPSDTLLKVPVREIDKIEIITNPSVKYDPDNVTGIINIVTRKKRLEGVSFIDRMILTPFTEIDNDLAIGYRTSWASFSIGFDIADRLRRTEKIQNSSIVLNDTVYHTENEGMVKKSSNSYGISAETLFYLSDKDYLTIGCYFDKGESKNIIDTRSEKWIDIQSDINRYSDVHRNNGSFTTLGYFISYRHEFEKRDQKLAVFIHSINTESNSHEYDTEMQGDTLLTSGFDIIKTGKSSMSFVKSHYYHPLNKRIKITFSYDAFLQGEELKSEFYDYNMNMADFIIDELFSHDMTNISNQHSLSGSLSWKSEVFSLRLGLHKRYNDQQIRLRDTNDKYSYQKWNLAPSIIASWKINKTKISTRFYRGTRNAWLNQLIPAEIWSSANSVTIGNPNLKPSRSTTMSLNIDRPIKRNLLMLSWRYFHEDNYVSSVFYPYSSSVIMQTWDNVGKRRNGVLTLRYSMKQAKWFNLNLSSGLSYSSIDGELDGDRVERDGISWNVKFRSIVKFGDNTRISFSSSVRGNEITAQGETGGYVNSDLGFSQDFLDKKLKLSISLIDVFRDQGNEKIIDEPGFYSYSYSRREFPVMINLRYNFNNYKDSGLAQKSVSPQTD